MPGELLQTGSAVCMERRSFTGTPSLAGTRFESFLRGNHPPGWIKINRPAFPPLRSECTHSAVGQFRALEVCDTGACPCRALSFRPTHVQRRVRSAVTAASLRLCKYTCEGSACPCFRGQRHYLCRVTSSVCTGACVCMQVCA